MHDHGAASQQGGQALGFEALLDFEIFFLFEPQAPL